MIKLLVDDYPESLAQLRRLAVTRTLALALASSLARTRAPCRNNPPPTAQVVHGIYVARTVAVKVDDYPYPYS